VQSLAPGLQVRAALALPVYLSRHGGDRAPAGVVELVYGLLETVTFADAMLAVGCALQGAGLQVSFNRSFCFSPVMVRGNPTASASSLTPAHPQLTADQAPVLYRLSLLLESLSCAHDLPMAWAWSPSLLCDDRVPHGTRPSSRDGADATWALHCRGMPACVRDVGLWGLQIAVAERALRCAPPQGLAGAACVCAGAAWVAAPGDLRGCSNPLRSVQSMFAVECMGALAVTVSAQGARSSDIPFVVELILPRACDSAEKQLHLLSSLLPALAAQAAGLQLDALLALVPPAHLKRALEAMADAASNGESETPTAFLMASSGTLLNRSEGADAVPPSFFAPNLQRHGTAGGGGDGALRVFKGGVHGGASAAASACAHERSSTAPLPLPLPPPRRAMPPPPPRPRSAPQATAAGEPVKAPPPAKRKHAGGDASDAGGSITLAQLRAQFQLPLKEAARALGVCATTLKTTCRRHGIPRWPFRALAKIATQARRQEGAQQAERQGEEDKGVGGGGAGASGIVEEEAATACDAPLPPCTRALRPRLRYAPPAAGGSGGDEHSTQSDDEVTAAKARKRGAAPLMRRDDDWQPSGDGEGGAMQEDAALWARRRVAKQSRSSTPPAAPPIGDGDAEQLAGGVHNQMHGAQALPVAETPFSGFSSWVQAAASVEPTALPLPSPFAQVLFSPQAAYATAAFASPPLLPFSQVSPPWGVAGPPPSSFFGATPSFTTPAQSALPAELGPLTAQQRREAAERL